MRLLFSKSDWCGGVPHPPDAYAAGKIFHAGRSVLWYNRCVKISKGVIPTSRHFVYLLRCSDNSLYCGYATDVMRRLAEHNSGKGAKYTRSRLPAVLVYTEELPTRSDAMRREAAIKKLTRQKKLLLLDQSETLPPEP